MKRYVLNTHCTCVHIQNGCKKIMFSSSTGNYYRDQMPTYLKKRQNNTLNKKCVSCYQSLMGCRICERTNKAVEATRLSQKNIIPHIRDFSLYPLQQIQSSKCINGPGIGKKLHASNQLQQIVEDDHLLRKNEAYQTKPVNSLH